MTDLFYDIKKGIENIIKWLPIIWKDRDWDWAYLAEIMEFKLRNMADHNEKYSYHVGAEKEVRSMRVCAALLKRLRDDNVYYDNAEAACGGMLGTGWADKVNELSKADSEYLFKVMNKRMRHWWC